MAVTVMKSKPGKLLEVVCGLLDPFDYCCYRTLPFCCYIYGKDIKIIKGNFPSPFLSSGKSVLRCM
jgi:hypothetical protein